MYGYFANKSKHRLIVKNIYKNMAIYLKNRCNNDNTSYKLISNKNVNSQMTSKFMYLFYYYIYFEYFATSPNY